MGWSIVFGLTWSLSLPPIWQLAVGLEATLSHGECLKTEKDGVVWISDRKHLDGQVDKGSLTTAGMVSTARYSIYLPPLLNSLGF